MKPKLPEYEASSDNHLITTFKNWSRPCNLGIQRKRPQGTTHITYVHKCGKTLYYKGKVSWL